MTKLLSRLPLRHRIALAIWLMNGVILGAVLTFALR